jgi:hypothetical protein
MKKFFSLLIAGSLLAGFVACGPSEDDKTKTEDMLREMSADTASLNKAMNEFLNDTSDQHMQSDTSHVH